MKVRSGASGASAAAVGFVWKPPSSATCRGERPRAARLRDRLRQRLVLASVARRRGRRQDEATRARVPVRSHLGQPLEVAAPGRAAQRARAERARVRVEAGHEPGRARLPGQTRADLLDHLLAARDQRLQPLDARTDPGRLPPRLRSPRALKRPRPPPSLAGDISRQTPRIRSDSTGPRGGHRLTSKTTGAASKRSYLPQTAATSRRPRYPGEV